MNATTRIRPAMLLAIAFALTWSSSLLATPMSITVERHSSSDFNAGSLIAWTLLDTGDLTGPAQSNTTLSPSFIDLSNIFFPLGLTDPFLGTGVDWSVTATALIPQGILLTKIGPTAINSSDIDYFMRVIVEADTYALPGSNGANLVVSTVYSNSAMTDAMANISSEIDSTPIGVEYSFSTTGTSPSFSATHSRGNFYSLRHVYEISMLGNSTPSSANLSTTTSVVVPEPSAFITASLWGFLTLLMTRRRARLN